MLIEFDVPIVKGKARPRFANGHVYTPASTRTSERQIANEYMRVCKNTNGEIACAPRGTSVEVEITVQKPLPQGRPKSCVWEHDTTKPDLDNVAKLVLDALNGLAWADDAQITTLNLHKNVRTQEAKLGTHIRIVWGA